MNLAQVTPIEIQNWTKEQTCAALVEAKKNRTYYRPAQI